MSQKSFDVAIIGSGPGGYVAAIRAAQLGKTVALVEANHLGGICLNWGCIPTKALLRSSEVHHLLSHSKDYGFDVKGFKANLKAIVQRSRDVSAQLSTGVKHLMKKNKITVFEGWGKLDGKADAHHKISVEKKGTKPEAFLASHVILATGARPRELPNLKPDGKDIWTYKEAMVPSSLPKSLLVIGSGAIGIEFASFYKEMGVDVTVIEMMDRILPVEDKEISAMARKLFEAKGLKIHTDTVVKELKKSGKNLTATLESKDKKTQTLTAEKAIVAVGIVGNIENIGLEKTKIKTEKNQILTNPWGQTDEPGIYAIGDVAGAPWLAHKASHEGIIAVEHLVGKPPAHPLRQDNIPGCTYSAPQIASVGLTEEKAKAAGHTVKVGRFPYIGNGKAIALGETDGMIKTLFDAKTGELLGAHMIGAEVTELIQGFVLARTLEATEEEIMHTIFPHPTLSEMMHESTLSAYDKAVHM